MTKGPLGTSLLNWRTLLMYRSTEEGTAALPPRVGSGKVIRSGRSAKLRRNWKPPRRTERDQFSDEEMASPACMVVSARGSSLCQLLSSRV